MDLTESYSAVIDNVISIFEQEKKGMTAEQKDRARRLIADLENLLGEVESLENFSINETDY